MASTKRVPISNRCKVLELVRTHSFNESPNLHCSFAWNPNNPCGATLLHAIWRGLANGQYAWGSFSTSRPLKCSGNPKLVVWMDLGNEPAVLVEDTWETPP